ncbi:MAG: PilT/PilU family type 4a pilus ATPase [Candidatus Margulisiibacteriota bacterium]|nr:PilT/PilU family type 4a pilus ATPase [Candidatus Margulisiibacteriota bacterium]
MYLKTLLSDLNKSRASDLLLAVGNPPALRINTFLQKQREEPLTEEEISELIKEIISKEDLVVFKKEKELDTSYEDMHSRYRVNLHYQKGTIAATIRRVPNPPPSFNELNLPQKIKDLTQLERGLVLVTGPTGCGKSTTQAAMIDHINATRSCHIITIEDPIEYMHTPKLSVVEQREVGIDTKSFGEALKRVLRQIPDVILVGEMRDLESIQMAVTAAETGHLVISTLHTQDAVQSVDRMIDVFPPYQQLQIRSMLSLCLEGIISQQLIPKADNSGLAMALEIMIATTAIRNIIRKGSTQDIYSMVDLGTQYGMISMDVSLRDLVKKKRVTKDTAMVYAANYERLEKMLRELA